MVEEPGGPQSMGHKESDATEHVMYTVLIIKKKNLNSGASKFDSWAH